MNSKIFRQVSIERLSSPEQLDQVLRVTSFHSWLSLLAILAILGAAVSWGFRGSVVSTASGEGLLVHQGGVLNIVARGGGIVVSIGVKPGGRVHKNQAIATIAQPVLAERLASIRAALDNARRGRLQNLQIGRQTAKLQVAAIEHQRATTQLLIRQLEDRANATSEQIKSENGLFAKGLVTHQQVTALQQNLADIRQQVETANAQMPLYDSQEFTINAQPEQADLSIMGNVGSLERQMEEAKKELDMSQNVASPFDGEVLETKVYPGGTVSTGQPLISIQPDTAPLELVAYLPSWQAKDTAPEEEVQISPLNIKREEYGFIRGKVTYIADYPSTPEALLRNFENQSLVQSLSQGGPVTEIRASLQRSDNTVSGMSWSTSKGPASKISSGTMCSIRIVTKRQAPVTLLFPYLRNKFGLS